MLPKKPPGRANAMAQSITKFFRRSKAACHVTTVDTTSRHTNGTQQPSVKMSRKRRLGHLQAAGFQHPRNTAPSSNGLVSGMNKPTPTAQRIPSMFKAKRTFAAQKDSGKHSKDHARPTLATTVFAAGVPQASNENALGANVLSDTLQSVFDMADVYDSNAKRQHLMPKVSEQNVLSPTDSSGMPPCAMAPEHALPAASLDPYEATTHFHQHEGPLSAEMPRICTPTHMSPGSRSMGELSFESVHTPPEVALSAILECPGAPVKKRGDADAFEVVSRLSSLSVDSVDMCDGPFAPGAASWSPRAEVRRALRFD